MSGDGPRRGTKAFVEEIEMNRRNWLLAALLALPAVVGGGFAYASLASGGGYICPITGERLACENCCPLNQQTRESYVCPATGEELPCEQCCPLNQGS